MDHGKLGVCQNTLRSGDLAQDVEWAARAGLTGLGVMTATLESLSPQEARRVIRDGGLEVSSYESSGRFLPPAQEPSSIELGKKRIEEAAELGSPNLLVTTGPALDISYEEADKRSVDWLSKMAGLAGQAGVRLMLEPVHPIMHRLSHVHRLRHALDIVAHVESVGVVVDTGHLWWDKDFIADFTANVDAIATVQIDDVPGEALQEYRYARCKLGEGDIPLRSLLPAMDAAGYKGYYEIEIIMRLPRDERESFLHESRAFFDALWR